jgi:hypothetical protein
MVERRVIFTRFHLEGIIDWPLGLEPDDYYVYDIK